MPESAIIEPWYAFHNMKERALLRGFTIIELLVVIAIIGILSAIAITGTAQSRVKARTQAALQTLKGMHDAAIICLNSSASGVSWCTPGQTTGGCGASVSGDTNNGGGALVCLTNSVTFAALPTGWIYCNGGTTEAQGATGCGNDITSYSASNFTIRAENNNDGWNIICRESGCTADNTDVD
jgi:prepilin-type N-terminal cleavage/methylation domain-containing protein